jgi:hypothetical protein
MAFVTITAAKSPVRTQMHGHSDAYETSYDVEKQIVATFYWEHNIDWTNTKAKAISNRWWVQNNKWRACELFWNIWVIWNGYIEV